MLRDITERIVVASKGRFDRAMTRRQREKKDFPSEGSIYKDEFMEATLDLWEIPPESASRVGHPAPFPVELPRRLVELYTYREDLVLDPFMGSGSTAIAALRSERHFVGYEIDPHYAKAIEQRVKEERAQLEAAHRRRIEPRVVLPAQPEKDDDGSDPFRRAVRQGQRAKEIARVVLEECGFEHIEHDRSFGNGVEVNFVAEDCEGRKWFFDVSGAFTSNRPGLRRTDTLWKALGKAAVLQASKIANYRLVFLTTDLPPKNAAGDLALRTARVGGVFHDAIPMLSIEGQDRLRSYAAGEGYDEPLGDLLTPNGTDEL